MLRHRDPDQSGCENKNDDTIFNCDQDLHHSTDNRQVSIG